MDPMDAPTLATVFAHLPGLHILLKPDAPHFTIVAASKLYLEATNTKQEFISGKGLFEVFPENPDAVGGIARLSHSLEKVMELKKVQEISIHQYDLLIPNTNQFETRYWKTSSTPVFNEAGNIDWIIHTVEDMTDQKRMEERVRLSESQMSMILQNTEDVFIIVDPEYRIVTFNDAAATNSVMLFGKELEKGKSILEYAPEDQLNSIKRVYDLALKGQKLNHKFSPGNHQGIATVFDISYIPVMNEEKVVVNFIISARNITTDENTAQALLRSEGKYRTLFYANPLPMWIHDFETKQFLEVNNAAIKHYGYSREEFLNMTIRDIRPTADLPALEQVTMSFEPGHNIHHGEWRHLKKNGELMEVEVTSHSMDYNGRHASLVLIIDNSERRKAEAQELFERRDKEALINATTDMIWSVSKSFKLVAANTSFINAIQAMTGKIIQTGDSLLMNDFAEDFLDFWKNRYTRALEGAVFKEEVYTPSIQNYPETWSEIRFNPIYKGNDIVGIACYGRNITEQKQQEQELIKINQKLETAQQIASLGYWEFSLITGDLYWSDETYRIFGMVPGNKKPDYETFINAVHPEDKLRFEEEYAIALRGEKALFIEHRIVLPDGQIKTIIGKGALGFNENGVAVKIEGTVMDITKRKKAEESIRYSEEKISLIMNAALDAIICIDLEGIITFWNPQAERIFGWTAEEAIGQVLSSLIIPHPFNKMHDRGMAEYAKTGEGAALNVLLELTAKNRAGNVFPVELTVLPIKQRGEEFFCAFIRDITERKKAENEIRVSNERYDLVAKATNDSIWDWDLVTNQVIRMGKKLETLFGYDGKEPEEVDAFWSNTVHPEDWQRLTKKRNLLIQDPKQTYWDDEYRFLKTDGSYGYVYDRGYIIRNKFGEAIRMIGASQDITRDKEQVNEIIRIQQNLDSLINTTNDLIWSVNTDLEIISFNMAYSNFIRRTTGQVIIEGQQVLSPGFDSTTQLKWNGYYSRAAKGEIFNVEESLLNPLNDDHWDALITFSPIVHKDGIAGVACYAKDVTALKKSEQQLQEVNLVLQKRAEELATSNTELERFAYVASHDLQEPLRMVSSFLQLLEKKYQHVLDAKAREYINFAVGGADRMKKLILDLLAYSRIGTEEEVFELVDMNALVGHVLHIFESRIKKENATIEVLPLVTITGINTQLQQLIQNLIGNAIKYKSKEPLHIEFGCREEETQVVFYVKDNGIGIDPKYFDKIFIVFQRLHAMSSYSGTGVGLAICKKIVERHKGNIWVESEPGIGSTFFFSIAK